MNNLNVFTYNLRIDVQGDGKNSFQNRRDFILARFPSYGAALVGFQETAPHMRQWLIENLAGYQVCGLGREADLQGESNPIAYRADLFELVAVDMFWLSDTPWKPGSRFATDQSDCPRICTVAALRHRESGHLLRCYNTHLDHLGPIAQAQGISLVLARMAEDYARWPMPVILMGDFNAFPHSPVYKSAQGFAGCGAPLVDVTAGLGGTFHDFGRLAQPQKIDYIFTNLPCNPAQSLLAQDEAEGVYLSDHYPVGAVVEP